MKKIRRVIQQWPVTAFFCFWIFYFAAFWSRAVYFDARGNFWAGHVNIWGDWAAHFTMGTAMAQRGLLLTHSPFLLGAPFSYPFIADLISAILLRNGVSLIDAFTIPSFVFSLLIVTALYFFYNTFFKSRKIAIVATCIFLFNGGIGFYYFIQDIFQSATPWFTLLNPAHEYTRLDAQGIKWISVIDSMIIPERSFALGFSCALIALTLIFKLFFSAHAKKTKVPIWQLTLVGILLGLLPILHTHSFLATFIFLSWWAIIDLLVVPKNERLHHFWSWLTIAGVTAAIALPLMKLFFLSNLNSDFFHWHPGWMAGDFSENWWLFTWKNWGITPILALVSLAVLIRKQAKTRLAWLLLPSFLIFILGNLFLFQPWAWDNTKLLVWFLLGSSGLIAYFLVYFYQLKWTNRLLQSTKAIVLLFLFLVVTASGIIDAYRIQRLQLHSYILYADTDIGLANWVKNHTSTQSIWLTGHPHNHWLFNLTGRQSVMAYPGWLWTQGYNYLPVQDDVRVMYEGNERSLPLLAKYQVNYVVIGDNERYDLQANESFFIQHFSIVYQLGTTEIYQVK